MGRPFVKLIIFYISFLWASSFLRAIVPPHILSRGIDFKEMTIGLIVLFSGQILLFFFLNKNFPSKLSWFLGMICFLLSVLLVIDVKSANQYYLSSLFNGFLLFLFWVFYNIAHFKSTPKEKIGISSGVMFGIWPLVGVVAPLTAGFLGEINLVIAWAVSLAFITLSAFLIKFQTNFSITFDIKESIKEISSTRLFIFISGVADALNLGLIPIYTLFFIKSALGYGSFLAYLSLLSVFATLLIGRLSDKLQKRIIFLYPVTIVMGAVSLLFTLGTENIIIWIVLSGIISFLVPIFWNISTAMVVDMSPNLEISIPGREITLALGRLLGLSFVLISFMYEQKPFYIFLVLGIIILLYPLLLFWSSKIRKKYHYL